MAKLSISKYDTFRTCPRLYYFQHVLYLERVRQEGARRYGDIFHKGLEAWWPEMGWGDNPPPWIDRDGALRSALKSIDASATHIETDPYDVARAKAMMTAYHVMWQDLDFDLLVDSSGAKAVETWFEVPLRDPDGTIVPRWFVNGKKDALARFSGVPRVVEHKTTGKEIDAGSDYFNELTTNLQVSCYIDTASQYLNEPVDGALYDVSRKPDVAPFRATPEEEREYTKGKGCKSCGGTVSGEIKPGSGFVLIERGKKGKLVPAVEAGELSEPCPDCIKTPGMQELPRLYAKHHDHDEPVPDYEARVYKALTDAPNSHFWQGVIRRSEHELMEARADLVAMALEVDRALSQQRALPTERARLAWPRNHKACHHQYGRRCDFYEICTTNADPMKVPLYRIKQHPNRVPAVQL
jgi:hypothetical protein